MARVIATLPSSRTAAGYHEHKRADQAILTQPRTGHVALNGYLSRFGRVDSPQCVRCGEVETVAHFLLRCPRFFAQRSTLRGRLRGQVLSVRTLLGVPKKLICIDGVRACDRSASGSASLLVSIHPTVVTLHCLLNSHTIPSISLFSLSLSPTSSLFTLGIFKSLTVHFGATNPFIIDHCQDFHQIPCLMHHPRPNRLAHHVSPHHVSTPLLRTSVCCPSKCLSHHGAFTWSSRYISKRL